MRIGTIIYSWDDCSKCVLFDAEHGCKKAGEIEILTQSNAVFCLTGQKSERDNYADIEDIDFDEPWE